MNTNPRPESQDDAALPTAVGLGERPADTVLSAEARAEADAVRGFAEELRAAYAREPLPFVNTTALAQRATGDSAATRRRASRVGGSIAGRRVEGWSWRPVAGVAAAACVALALVAMHRGESPAAAPRVAASPPVAPSAMTMAARVPTVASLAAGMPGLAEAGPALLPAGRASVALAAPNAALYAELVRREYASGRPVVASRLRVDALVNAFVEGRAHAAPGAKSVQLETALVSAPWDAGRRVLRVTLRGYGRPGEIVATRLAAAVDFDPATVRGWRPLGHEGGVAGRAAVSFGGGDAVTTLYEIDPVPGVSSDAVLARVALEYSAAGRKHHPVTVVTAAAVAPESADPDTRFAVALVAYAGARTPESGAALLACAGDAGARREFVTAFVR